MSANPAPQDWKGRQVWVVGASSGIGLALASLLHTCGAVVTVSARNAAALQAFAQAHAGSQALALDVCDTAAVQAAVRHLAAQDRLDWVIYCAGHYRAQRGYAPDLEELLRHNDINYLGAARLVSAVVPALLARSGPERGHISLVASVAGYRGLPNSLAYGPTKAALINFAEALYLDLRAHGVGVSLVNPGFVATPLTAQNDFDMPALLTPVQAAQAMVRGWERGAFEIHFPRRFTWAMKLLQHLPHSLYAALMRRINAAP